MKYIITESKYIKAVHVYLDEILGDEIFIKPWKWNGKQYYTVVSQKNEQPMFDFGIGRKGWFFSAESNIYYTIEKYFSIDRDTARNYFINWFFEKHGMNGPKDFKRFISDT